MLFHPRISSPFLFLQLSNPVSGTIFRHHRPRPQLSDVFSIQCALCLGWCPLRTHVSRSQWDHITWVDGSVEHRGLDQCMSMISMVEELDSHSLKSRPLRGKLTIVGFFSSTKAFFVNRLKWRMIYWGRRWHLKRLNWPADSWPILTG